MAWKVEGTYFETCSCNVVCPCTVASFDIGSDYDRCAFALVFSVARGEIDGTDVSGAKVVAIGDTPKVMTDGSWNLGVFIDAKTDEQADKLAGVFGGAMGGPMGGIAPLVGEMRGVERATIDIREDGLEHSVKIGDSVEFAVQDVVPFGIENGQPSRAVGIFHPAGSELTIAKTTDAKINAFGITVDGKSAFSAPFSWAA
ncbi:MAG TPA: DUF1326 domain-containing protein [Gaiellaceae bacterium]|nr:DUF1326 domain-containing protein [Gaiellaceae bacterium]